MAELSSDERQELRKWVDDPWTQRFMEYVQIALKADFGAMRANLLSGDVVKASFLNGAMTASENVLGWADNLLAIKPHRPEGEE